MKKYDYDINNETVLIKFFKIFLDKEESLLFFKKLKEKKIEIKDLISFINVNKNSPLQSKDIYNLKEVYTFFD